MKIAKRCANLRSQRKCRKRKQLERANRICVSCGDSFIHPKGKQSKCPKCREKCAKKDDDSLSESEKADTLRFAPKQTGSEQVARTKRQKRLDELYGPIIVTEAEIKHAELYIFRRNQGLPPHFQGPCPNCGKYCAVTNTESCCSARCVLYNRKIRKRNKEAYGDPDYKYNSGDETASETEYESSEYEEPRYDEEM
jgi:hypothetical protein